MRTTSFAALALCGALLTACTGGEPPTPASKEHRTGPTTPTVSALDPDLSLTEAGRQLLSTTTFARTSPRIDVKASADPGTGRVDGTVRLRLPVDDTDQVRLRFFPGLDSFKADAHVGPVTVDGLDASATQDEAIVTVPLPAQHGNQVVLDVPFGYVLPETQPPGILDALGGGSLEPADIGLLARHPQSLALGHWFPIWVPEGRRADPVPSGFGDISNYPAADLSLQLTVPQGWTVVDSAVRAGEQKSGGRTTITSYGTGMRDVSAMVVKGFESVSRAVDGVTVRLWGPRADAPALDAALEEAVTSVRVLSQTFGGYPWKEVDIVSASLGAGVAGMEWPGATWIESATLGGGIPGLGDLDLGDLGDLGDLEGLLGDELELVKTIRPWTIAHEVGHQWWTILVGNDSIADPVVDEPLAQYSACLVARASLDKPDNLCRGQFETGYAGMAAAGASDAVADQATDEFASAAQYGGVIYGKAPYLYLALEKQYGAGRVAEALRQVVREHAFGTIDGAGLRASLTKSLGSEAGRLWDRWMEQAHGDQDMPRSDSGQGGLGALRDLLEQLGG